MFGKGKAKVLMDVLFDPREGELIQSWEILKELQLLSVGPGTPRLVGNAMVTRRRFYPDWTFEYVGYFEGGPGYVGREKG